MVENVVAKMARIPPKSVSSSDRDALRTLERDLKLTIFGQDQAIEALSSAIKMSRSGLREEEKPIGSFLFAGPTGVGKTEVTRQLALCMGVELIRFDMSEYMERHTVSRAYWCAAGLRRFRSGWLADRGGYQEPACSRTSRRNRESTSGSLQPAVAGNGSRHTDGQQRPQGGLPQCHHCYDDQCGRAGNESGVDRFHAAGSQQRWHGDHRKAFSPEFRNRLDAIIQFASLDIDSVKRVVDKLVVELEAKLGSNNVTFELDDAAREWIAERGYDPKMGARPMARIIQEHIKRPLAEELLFGSLADGGHVRITVG